MKQYFCRADFGLIGLIGLTAGGWIADAMHQRARWGWLMVGVASLSIAAAATGWAVALGAVEVLAPRWHCISP